MSDDITLDFTETDTDAVHVSLRSVDTAELDADDVSPRLPADPPTLMQQFDDWMQKEGHPDSTRYSYRNAVNHLLYIVSEHDDDTLSNLDRSRVRDYLQEMANPNPNDDREIKPFADNTVNGRLAGWTQFYDFLDDVVSGNEFDPNPARETTTDFLEHKTNKEKKLKDQAFHAVSREQMETLCANVPDRLPYRNELLIRMAFQTGGRASELVRITEDRLQFNSAGELSAVELPATKTTGRTVPIEDESLRRLYDVYQSSQWRTAPGVPSDTPYLFPSQESNDPQNGHYEHITEAYANELVTETAENAGLRHEYGTDKQGNVKTVPTCHSLRHGYAVESIKCGRNLYDLKIAMGHENLESTIIYLKALTSDATERLRRTQPSGENVDTDERVQEQLEIDSSVFLGSQHR